MQSIRYANGVKTNYLSDSRGRLQSIAVNEHPSLDLCYTYDGNNNIIMMNNTQYQYDSFNRLVEVVQGNETTSFDPQTGRFISTDPVKDGLNWYAYCNNNPIVYIDPSGLFSVSIHASGRDVLINKRTGDIDQRTLYKVKLLFMDPFAVAAKAGFGSIGKAGNIITAYDIISNLVFRGDIYSAVYALFGGINEKIGMALASKEFVDALKDFAIKRKFEEKYGKGSSSKLYTKDDLMSAMRPILNSMENGPSMKELEKMINNAKFETWLERIIDFSGPGKDWYKLGSFGNILGC